MIASGFPTVALDRGASSFATALHIHERYAKCPKRHSCMDERRVSGVAATWRSAKPTSRPRNAAGDSASGSRESLYDTKEYQKSSPK